jgi:hypothetical protein
MDAKTIEKKHTFICGPGRPPLSQQADEMNFILDNAEHHQLMIDRATALYEHGVLHPDEVAAVYNRIIKKLLPDLSPKTSIITLSGGEIQVH